MYVTHNLEKVALGGGCHWCTEALFLSLRGVAEVEQGFISSKASNNRFAEGVVIHFNSAEISLKTLIEVHLHTHKCTSDHYMRNKYRSAVYTYSEFQRAKAAAIINEMQLQFENNIITEVLLFNSFRSSEDDFKNYYYSNPEKPFCKNYINPKLQVLLSRFRKVVDLNKLEALLN